MSRTLPLHQFSLFVLALLCFRSACAGQGSQSARDHVDPFIGTGGHGHTFPGACVPNGMVQLSPDTRTDGVMDWDGCSGYHHSDSLIYGFSHTHLSGTGVPDLCDVLLMPMSGAASTDPTEYRSSFSHENEQAKAGYYRVWLDDERTLAEMTATAHVGVHRYTMPQDQAQHIVLDLGHRDKLIASSMAQVRNEIVGERRSSSWAADQRLYYCIRIGRQNGTTGIALEQGADSTKGIIALEGEGPGAIIVKVGISAVSVDGARANLEAEVPGWDFDLVRKQAEDAWDAKLNRIKVEGGTEEQQRIFYSALYHCYVAPYLFNDVDGNYRGMDGEVHHADHPVYTVFSLWDTFRGLHPLMTILEPEMTSDWIKTFLLHYEQSGRLPVWELWGNETDCMIGYHSVSVIADAFLKGIRGFDEDKALEAMLASAMRDEPGLNAYRTKGWIASEDQSESVSKTLEYAFDDGCIAAYKRAQRDGGREVFSRFEERAKYHLNLAGPEGFYRARRNGGFMEPFDPYEVNFNFTEANAWQYSLFATQDMEGLLRMYGGAQGLERQLDDLFSATSVTNGRDQADITGLIGQYAHGNEPSHHMAYLYNEAGTPEKTRNMVHRILNEQYSATPDGLSGNEDCGQMSAWYVLSAMGFYPIAPGIDDRYQLGYPLFEKATIHLADDRKWSVTVAKERASSSAEGSLPLRAIDHGRILSGPDLVVDPDRVPLEVELPTTELPTLREMLPCDRPGAPIIESAGTTFKEEQQVFVRGCGSCTVIEVGTERPCPMEETFSIGNSCTVAVQWHPRLAPVTAQFHRLNGERTITLQSDFAPQYRAGGDQALVDGLRGGVDFRTGEWQGFEGQDLQATIDLGKPYEVSRIGLSVLQDQRSWIWSPSSVEFAFSVNARQWSTVKVGSPLERTAMESQTLELWTGPLEKRARYIKVIATNAGACPDWHPGKGGKTWIFADEVLIDLK